MIKLQEAKIMLQERINNAVIPYIDVGKYSAPIPAAKDAETELENAIDLLDKLSGTELKRIKQYFDKKFSEVVKKDSNYIMHDFLDDYFYIVYFYNGTHHLYSKGEDAYNNYMSDGIRLERKTKDLFPMYETLLEKEYVKPIRINQKSKKELQKMDKQKYDLAYQKDNIKQVKFTLNKNTDQDIIKKLDTVQNKNGYLKDLIRQDLKKTG